MGRKDSPDTWIFQVCKIYAFSPKKTYQKAEIWHIWRIFSDFFVFLDATKRPNKDLEALFSTCNIEVATSRREHSNIQIQPGGLFCRDTPRKTNMSPKKGLF